MTWLTDFGTNAADLLSFLFVTPTLLGEKTLISAVKKTNSFTSTAIDKTLTFWPRTLNRVKLSILISVFIIASFSELYIFRTFYIFGATGNFIVFVFGIFSVLTPIIAIIYVVSSEIVKHIESNVNSARVLLIAGAMLFAFTRFVLIINALNEPWHSYVIPFLSGLPHTLLSGSPPSGVTIRLHPP